MKRLISVVLTLLMLVGVAGAVTNQGPDKRYPIEICTEQTGTRHGVCYWVQAFPVGSAGLGSTARLQAVSAALYAYSMATGTPIRIEAGTGTSAGALRVTSSSDSADIAILTAIQVAVEAMAAWDDGAGATTVNTLRTVPANDSPGVTTAEPGYCRQQDGDSAVLADVLDTFTDNLAYTLNGGMQACVIYGDDGATLDMAAFGPAGGIQVFINNHPSAFDESNSNVNVDIDNHTPFYANAENSGTIVGAPTVVCAAVDVSTYGSGCFYIKNQGGAGGGAFTAATYSTSADNTDWTTPIALGTPCDALTTGQTCVFCWDSSFRWIRASVTAAAAANDTTVRCTRISKM